MVILVPNDRIWIEAPDSTTQQFSAPIGAKVSHVENDQVFVIDDEDREIQLNEKDSIRVMHPSSIDGVENLTDLGDLHEAAILRNLLIRFRDHQKRIYTFVGSILVAVNPHEQLNIYTLDFVRSYHKHRLGELPAHIFAIAESALADVCKSQYGVSSVVISGESGSGKTESSKLILHYLAAVCGQHSFVEQQLLEANPIIEAFGNACTVHNNNSSRFGKYTKLFLDQNGRIKGARLTKFLLEKNRVAQPRIEERNFHIFYMLLKLSAKERAELELQGQASSYHLLSQCKNTMVEGRDDTVELKSLREALKILSFSTEEAWQIFSVLAALLHLGNLNYKTTTKDNMEVTELDDTQNVTRIAKLLQVENKQLIKALTVQSILAAKETVRRNLSSKQALDQRDALIKTIYNLLFEYIIEFINETLGASLSENECKTNSNTHNYRAIGILDIFGFENLRENSFEQLCFNYANETLQQFFIRQIFKLEQADYKAQQIGWQHLDYFDNQPVINLLAASHLGVFQLIDEESILPQGTDESLLQKLHTNHSEKSSEYMKPSSNLIKSFGVRHYVGGFVSYSIKDFLPKNRDTFGGELRHLVGTSKCKLIRKIFNCANHPLLQTQAETHKQTVGQSFRKSLKLLVAELENTEPLFIRCLRPNDQKLPHVFDRSTVLRQLRNLGLAQTTAIRQAGYPIRHDYTSFVRTYYGLVSNLDTSDCIRASEKILTIILGQDADFQMGKTKIFLKNDDDVFLQREREKMLDFYAISIQKNLRAYAKRRYFLKLRQATLLIQTTWRAFLQRKRYKQILAGISRFQAILRSHQLVDRYGQLREQVIQFQACCRGLLLRNRLDEIAQDRAAMTTNGVNGVEHEENDNSFLADDEISENDPTIKPSISKPNKLSIKVHKKFERFAAINFQDNASFRHTNQVLRKSLLEHQCVGDKLAALAIWIHILRFMRDLPESEPNSDSHNGSEPTQPIMSQLYARIYKNSKTIANSKSEKSLFKGQRVNSYDTFSRSSSKCSSTTLTSNTWFTNEALCPIDRVHLIIGYGILRPSLRDEIYCQLMKQLIDNPSRISCERGWLLLSLCLSSFEPSPEFATHVREFISEAPIRDILLERFEQCAQKGTRRQPPSYIEFQAAKNGKTSFVVNITFMDGLVKTTQANSSTTAHEICSQLAEKIQLKDRFGFSLYITMGTKVSSLGAGNDFLLDAISQCEQEARAQGHDERNAQWRLFYRKELFSPWCLQSTNSVANSLIYEQIIRGIHYNEYRCSESELALLAAQQFFIQQDGQNQMEPDVLEKQLTSLLPEAIVTKAKTPLDVEKWLQLIMNAHRKAFPPNTQSSAVSVKKEVCQFAMKRWPLLFSRFYEAYKFSGPPLPKNEVILAVNSTGFYVLDKEDQQLLLEAPFAQIMGIVSCLSKRMGTDAITIQLLNADEYTFQSDNAEDIRELVVFFLDGLRKRSKHFLVVEPFEGNQNWLSCKEGDLLKAIDEPEELQEEEQDECIFVMNMRTNETGHVPKDQLYIIPCIEDPSVSLLDEMRRRQELKAREETEEIDQVMPVYNNCTLDLVRLPIVHTLQKFAHEHFRPNDSVQELWRHSHEPLRRPLLKQTEPRLEVFEMYVALMKFMGDLPMLEPFNPVNLTTQIFTAPLKLPGLRDELYCQLIKQLTDNSNPLSEQRGWQLMWLVCGLFAPSKELHKELIQFLNSRRCAKTAECIARLNKTTRCGRHLRKHSPHQVEVDAIFGRTTQIFHKVFLPDGTNEAVEVESSSKAMDLCKQLGSMLGLKSVEGFSLFVKLGDKAVSIPEQEFFFDFITHVTQWSRQNQPTKPSTSVLAYQVIFMRKLWLNVKPGMDLAADLFHYYQEIPKYLHGFYAVSKHDAIKLASLILKAQTKENKEPPFGHFQQIIADLIPKDLLKTQTTGEWKKQIVAEYQQVTARSSLEAKVQFLKAVSQWTTFGSAFFEVKQSSDPTMASKIILAINQHGVSVLDHLTKRQIVNYPFNTIVNWTAGNTYFHLTVGHIVKGGRLLVETTLGYKMDDLISSYLQQFLHENSKLGKVATAYIEHSN